MFFIFSTAVFFSLLENEWVSEVKTFPGKKKKPFQEFCGKKWKKPPNFEKRIIYLFLTFLDLFLRTSAFLASEWLTNFFKEKKTEFLKIEWVGKCRTFPGKKNNLYFFFQKLEKKTKFSKIEWVSGVKLFRGKKKRYLLVQSKSH